MRPRFTRRRLVGGGVAGALAVLALPTTRSYLDLLAPGSGRVWDGLGPGPSGAVAGPYGDALISYDDDGVPHIEADDERALQFAHGYAQGADRLFQLDLFRRQLRGTLSAVAGEATVESDEFHRRMGFAEAAAASREAIADTAVEPILEAFVDGVNAAHEDRGLPVETALLNYDIDPWTATDSLLIEKLMGWELTGSFRTLRRAALGDQYGSDLVGDLYPPRYEHDVPVLPAEGTPASIDPPPPSSVSKPAVDWLSSFEPPPGQGSNSWIIGGEHTASGGPILANDPHLALMSPPVWYEVALETPAFATRGVTFPGVPFVVIGRNRRAAWGFTNVPADVMDFYTYEVEGDEYRVGDGWFEFETDTVSIEVAGGDDRTITRRQTLHGPYIDRHGASVAVSWTGFGGTRTIAAVHDLQRVADHDSLLKAMVRWDLPPQNLVYADDGGRTRYHVVGKVPIRITNGEPVRGDQVFDGSADEGRWIGFDPFGQPTWAGFVPLAELPHAVDPTIVSNANQRVADDPMHYHAEVHATPYRARRLANRLDAAVEAGDVDLEAMIAIQQDVHDDLAATIVPELLDVVGDPDQTVETAVDALEAWDFAMRADAWAPVVYDLWLRAFRERVFAEPLAEAGFDEEYVPSDWVLATLDPDHDWFESVGPRAEHMVAALVTAAEQAEAYDTFGDLQRSAIDHPFEVGFLGYPRRPMPGSAHTLKNYRRDAPVGPGWQQVVDLGADEARGRLAGGNSGRILSPHYDDQVSAWVAGVYKPIGWSPTVTRRLEFGGDGS